MAGEANLLRWLEPAVRPAGAPAPRIQPRPPVDQQSFEQLLRDAGGADAPSEPAPGTGGVDEAGGEASRLLRRLGQIGNVMNRTALGAAAQPHEPTG